MNTTRQGNKKQFSACYLLGVCSVMKQKIFMHYFSPVQLSEKSGHQYTNFTDEAKDFILEKSCHPTKIMSLPSFYPRFLRKKKPIEPLETNVWPTQRAKTGALIIK